MKYRVSTSVWAWVFVLSNVLLLIGFWSWNVYLLAFIIAIGFIAAVVLGLRAFNAIDDGGLGIHPWWWGAV